VIVLGLTGSIGMGKSTTAKFFAEAGIPVHDADAVVHRLYEGEAVAAIEQEFPGITRDGKVDRERLAQRVLGDSAALERLESIVHPLVRAAEARFLADAERAGAKYRFCSRRAPTRASPPRWWCRRPPPFNACAYWRGRA
jgi:dephospho-CoA kinase